MDDLTAIFEANIRDIIHSLDQHPLEHTIEQFIVSSLHHDDAFLFMFNEILKKVSSLLLTTTIEQTDMIRIIQSLHNLLQHYITQCLVFTQKWTALKPITYKRALQLVDRKSEEMNGKITVIQQQAKQLINHYHLLFNEEPLRSYKENQLLKKMMDLIDEKVSYYRFLFPLPSYPREPKTKVKRNEGNVSEYRVSEQLMPPTPPQKKRKRIPKPKVHLPRPDWTKD